MVDPPKLIFDHEIYRQTIYPKLILFPTMKRFSFLIPLVVSFFSQYFIFTDNLFPPSSIFWIFWGWWWLDHYSRIQFWNVSRHCDKIMKIFTFDQAFALSISRWSIFRRTISRSLIFIDQSIGKTINFFKLSINLIDWSQNCVPGSLPINNF